MYRFPYFIYVVKDALEGQGLGKLFAPIHTPANAAEVVFSGFGISNPGSPFLTGWQIEMDAGSGARDVQAFSSGTVYYEPGPRPRLVLQNADVLGDLVRRDTVPGWFPLPKFVIYANVDPTSIERRMKEYFARKPSVGILLRTQRAIAGPLEQAFMRGLAALPPVPVPAGEILGEAALSAPGRRRVEIYMQEELSNSGGLFLDPAIYHLHWQEFFGDLATHALRDQFIRPFAGPIANGTVRYVAKNGGSNAPYLTVADATDSIQDAIDAASAYDTIIVLDTQAYDEGDELLIEKPLTLTSLSAADVIATANPQLPTIDGDDDNRVVHVHSVGGVVSLTNLEITRGKVDSGAIPRAGAGLLIERTHSTYVRNCHIHHNENERSGLGNANGFGPGIHCHHSSAFIYANRITHNRCADVGAGIGVWGQGWPIIQANLIAHNETRQVTANSRPDGGGIGIENGMQEFFGSLTNLANWNQQQLQTARLTATRIVGNEIAHNEVDDDGGGIYLTILSRAELRSNDIHDNKAAKAGGGIRATEACELVLDGDRIRANEANFEQADAAERRNGGGGIGLRNASALLREVVIEGNIVHGWAGGGLFFNSVDLDDGEADHATHAAVLNNVLRPGQYHLEIEGGAIRDNHSRLFPGDVADHRKGGGLYVLRALTPPFGGPGVGLPFDVTIYDIMLVAGNHLDAGPLPLAAPLSVEIHVEDPAFANPIDDVTKANYVAGTTFTYHSP